MEDTQYGLLTRERRLNDWQVGGFTPLDLSLSNPEGNWSAYLPVDEFQNRWGYDRLACVTFSDLNVVEVLYKHQTGTEKNFSDRFIAKASGTTRYGNYLDNVFDTVRKIGLIEEYLYPDDANSWDEYYQELKPEFFVEAKKFLNDWDLYREWVRTDRKEDIFLALKSAPLQASVRYASGNGLLMPVGSWNHAITVFNASYKEYWEIFDHYTQTRKKYAWDYEFGAVLKPSLIKKNMKFIPAENQLYILVQGPEQKLGMGIGGKLMIYDEKIDTLLNSASRAKKYQIPTPMTLDQYINSDKVNGKGEPIN